jgi:hypothetical protein
MRHRCTVLATALRGREHRGFWDYGSRSIPVCWHRQAAEVPTKAGALIAGDGSSTRPFLDGVWALADDGWPPRRLWRPRGTARAALRPWVSPPQVIVSTRHGQYRNMAIPMGFARPGWARMGHLGAAVLTGETPCSPMRPLMTPPVMGHVRDTALSYMDPPTMSRGSGGCVRTHAIMGFQEHLPENIR